MVTSNILIKLNCRILHLNCKRLDLYSSAPAQSLCVANAKYLNPFRNVKNVMMQFSNLVLTSFHRNCQPTSLGKMMWLLGPCSPCLPLFTCLTINHTYITHANHHSNLLYLHCNLAPIFYLLFSLKFDTATHGRTTRDRIWILWVLNPYSYSLTTYVCYLQYYLFPSTNNSACAVWSQFINQTQKRRSTWFLIN